jgi:CheY-like chemotaxis protein/predicted regulator of Ras-like GTPase activity (Roadblock/LC7/MglB family)
MKRSPKKVLIVDDEEILTWIMSKTLSKDRKHYEVIIANDGHKAAEIMDSVPIDLVITDIRMPGMSGLDLLEHIREKHPQTKAIIMTAYGNPDVHREANERGCLHYLEKPFKIEDLRNMILEAIKPNKKGFVGQVADLQLSDIIQLNCIGKMKAAISVSKDDQQGTIYFEDGEIIHAECGGLIGEDALFTILGWEGGDFTTITGAEPKRSTINRNWQELLIEAMRRKDERQAVDSIKDTAVNLVDSLDEEFDAGEEIVPRQEGKREEKEEMDPRTHLRVVSSKSPAGNFEVDKPVESVSSEIPRERLEEPKDERPKSTKEKAEYIKKMLVKWQQETEEIQGAAVVTMDGITLASHVSHGEINTNKFSALIGSIFKVVAKGADLLRRGSLEEFYIKGREGTLHMYTIDSKALLAVLARADANMGMVHIESREHCKKVAEVLGF